MNDKNLVPINKRSESEQREMRSNGGKKSGETRRRKRDLRVAMKELLSLPVCDTDVWNMIAAMGVDPDKIDNAQALVVALFRKALIGGDVAAFREIRSLMGEDNDTERLKLQKQQARKKKQGDDGMLSEVLAALKNGDLAE